MKPRHFLLAAALGASLLAAPLAPAMAGANDPLFINLTSDDGHRVNMAFAFGGNQHKRGHQLTVFMNDRAVRAASKANAEAFAVQQKTIAELLASGATILVCPMCMKQFGVKEEDLLPGLKIGNPELTGNALFQDGTKTLTW
ncbi:DsrE family protein [Xanthobacter sp. AM11]|uniref:DsrE family protein n=1 Tax=Xanthobacter sp. AM11 TaxID=3380643 RepID=UPI0039BF2307